MARSSCPARPWISDYFKRCLIVNPHGYVCCTYIILFSTLCQISTAIQFISFVFFRKRLKTEKLPKFTFISPQTFLD